MSKLHPWLLPIQRATKSIMNDSATRSHSHNEVKAINRCQSVC